MHVLLLPQSGGFILGDSTFVLVAGSSAVFFLGAKLLLGAHWPTLELGPVSRLLPNKRYAQAGVRSSLARREAHLCRRAADGELNTSCDGLVTPT